MLITGRTDKGLVRQNNQDTFAVGEIADGCYTVVCDGMGGQQGGEVASQLACESVSAAILRDFASPVTGEARDTWIKGALDEAVQAANRAVFERGEADDNLAGMGTTIVAALIMGSTAYILHAGDSRAYLLREDTLTQVTTDHTMVQMLLERGDITESESRVHPQRHYITRALGVGAQVECAFNVVDLHPGDSLMVCTDGLYNYVDPVALPALVADAAAAASADSLIEAANAGGGGDNITAVLMGQRGEVDA